MKTIPSALACAALAASILSGAAAAQQLSPSGPGLRTLAPDFPLSADQLEFLSHVTMVDLPDGLGGFVRTARISGLNVQLVNGLEATNGYPADPDSTDPFDTLTNGLGNLIVGYNEIGNPDGDERTGSHNIVVGHGNTFTSFGGLVSARDNTISGAFASVSGGARNRATGLTSSISGGQASLAYGQSSSVHGGYGSTANGIHSSVTGGRSNVATGTQSSVSGGFENTATGERSSVSGGRYNTASGARASVTGGLLNIASVSDSSVSGGQGNVASGQTSSVSGGRSNSAIGTNSSVSGGFNHSAPGTDDWAAGALFEEN